VCAFVSRLAASMEHLTSDFHGELNYRNAKSPAFPWGRPGFSIYDLRRKPYSQALSRAAYQPRVRERIMKLSKVYSATCHHRYSSER
jgi:hypothetical protein